MTKMDLVNAMLNAGCTKEQIQEVASVCLSVRTEKKEQYIVATRKNGQKIGSVLVSSRLSFWRAAQCPFSYADRITKFGDAA